jgi:drug/metabolite transporter (DMT)-like permease
MAEPNPEDRREDDSFWHRRRPGIRYAYSVAAIVGGIALLVRYAIAQGGNGGGTWLLVGGLALLVIGAVSITVYRWMDKRRF